MENFSKLNIAVVCGGNSPENEVSRNSAQQISKALSANFGSVVVLELDRSLSNNLTEKNIDVVFPIAHGGLGENGALQGLLEIMDMAYVGSSVMASACAMNKLITKNILKNYNIPMAEHFVISYGELNSDCIKKIHHELGYDLVIKPIDSGSALGVVKLSKEDNLEKILKEQLSQYDKLLIEKKYFGKEITVAVYEEDNDLKTFPEIEITTPPGTWYDYEHRYTPQQSQHLIPANIDKSLVKPLHEYSLLVHKVLDCRDFSRLDFIVSDQNEIIFLEINTLPGMTSTSLYPDAANAAGLNFEQLVKSLIINAYRRKESRAVSNYDSNYESVS